MVLFEITAMYDWPFASFHVTSNITIQKHEKVKYDLQQGS